jgi:peroxiredoxin-like protein
MENKYEFKATAYWVLARRGIVSAEDVPQAIEFAAPAEFGGEKQIWTPEHFFLSAVASCYVATFRAIAEYNKFDTVALDVSAEGILEKEPGGYRFTEVRIKPVLTIANEENRAQGLKLLDKSAHGCLISRSLSSRVILEPVVEVSDLVAETSY